MAEATDRAPGLAGIRVVDLTGPRGAMCGRVLADLGAEVIRIEPPGGSEIRHYPPFAGANDAEPGLSLFWLTVSLGTKSVVLDIDSPGDREQLLGLISSADVFVESFDPGFLDGRGLGYAALSAGHPSLVYVSITPYGADGPDALSPATDLTLQAAGGLVSLQGDPDRPPIPVGGAPQAYFHAGAQAAADAIIALHERTRSGLGQRLDVSTQAAVAWTLMNANGYPPNTGTNAPGTCENRETPLQVFPGLVLPTLMDCADGCIGINVALPIVGGRTLDSLAKWMENEAALAPALSGRDWTKWIEDVVAGRTSPDDVGALVQAVQAFLMGKTKRQVQDFSLETGTIIGPVYTIEDIVADPQHQARDYFRRIDGRLHPGAFVRTRSGLVGPFERAPRPGEHQALLEEPRRATAPAAAPSAAPRERAFSGLKVADFSWVGVGPMITKALADHGATVVRIESETHPDVLRLVGPYKDSVPGLNRSQFWAYVNTSKLGLALDMSSPEARAVARRLVDWADIVVESFVPGTMAKLGFDYATLSKDRPGLIMLSTCLRGQTGPEAKYTGFGSQGAALAGIHSVTGWPDRPPSGPWGAYTDFINPRLGIAALGAAIRRRERSGQGDYLDLSQSEGGIRFLEPEVLDYTVNGRAARPLGARSIYATPSGVFACADRRYVAISIETPAQWQRLVAALALDEFSSPAFDERESRRAVEGRIESAIAAWCQSRPATGAAAHLKQCGVPAAAVAWPSELFHDAQLTHRGFFVTLDHLEMGPTPYEGLVTRFSATPGQLQAAPVLGQHTHEVMTGILGYSEDEVVELAIAGALT